MIVERLILFAIGFAAGYVACQLIAHVGVLS